MVYQLYYKNTGSKCLCLNSSLFCFADKYKLLIVFFLIGLNGEK